MKSLKEFVQSLRGFDTTSDRIKLRDLARFCGESSPISLLQIMRNCEGNDSGNPGDGHGNDVFPPPPPQITEFYPKPDIIRMDTGDTLTIEFFGRNSAVFSIPYSFFPEPEFNVIAEKVIGYPKDKNGEPIFPKEICGIRVVNPGGFIWEDESNSIIDFLPNSGSQVNNIDGFNDGSLADYFIGAIGLEIFAPFRSSCTQAWTFSHPLSTNRPNAPSTDFEGARLSIYPVYHSGRETYIEFIPWNKPKRTKMIEDFKKTPAEYYSEASWSLMYDMVYKHLKYRDAHPEVKIIIKYISELCKHLKYMETTYNFSSYDADSPTAKAKDICSGYF